MMLMALPNEHMLTFSTYKDAKALFKAIQARFGGNDATKKTQKTLLKQMYENFNASSTESLDSIFNRLQKIVSQLAILEEIISQEDLNLKFLRSLPTKWNTHVVAWRNKPEHDTMSIDDLYNNFKIVKQEVKRTVTTTSSSGSQNMAFVSPPGSTNEDNTANVQVSTASTPVSTASTNNNTANLSDATVYAFLANQPHGSHLMHEDLEQIHEDDLEEIYLKWQLALLSVRARKYYQRTGNGEAQRTKKAGQGIKTAQEKFFMEDEEVPTNMALVVFSDSEKNGFLIVIWDESEVMISDNVQHKPKQVDQPWKMVQKPVMNNVQKGTGQREVRPVWNNAMRTNHQNFSNSRRNFAPTAVLTKFGIVPIRTARQSSSRAAAPVSTARPINTAAPKPLVNVAKPKPNAFQKSHSLSRRPFYQQTALKNRILNNKVNTAKVNSVNTAKGKRVTSAVREQGINVVKSLACWVWRPKRNVVDHGDPLVALKDTRIFNSRCSRHMTGNKSYLSDYQDYDRGFIAFAGSSKGGKITGKVSAGNITNGNAGLETNSNAEQAGKVKMPDQEYILLPLLHTSSNVPSSFEEAESSPKDDARVKDPAKEGDMNGPGEATYTNSTNRLNTVSSPVNTVSSSSTFEDPGRAKEQRNEFESLFGQEKDNNNTYRVFTPVNSPTPSNTDYSIDPLIPNLEDTVNLHDTGIFGNTYDEKDEGAEADYNNLEIKMPVSPIPSTRIHKDHPKAQIIGEMDSTIGRSYVGRASLVQATKCLDTGGFTSWKEGHWIEAIMLFLSHASYMDFTVYQMDVNSAFFYGTIEEEVYVSQPPGFVDPEFPNKVYKVEKALYGLHQAPKAWYETLLTYLLENGFRRGTMDKTLFIKKIKNDILLVQVYVDDIIFGSTKKSLSLQVEQRKDGIFLSQDKYVYDILKKFGFSSVLWLQNQLLDYGYNFMKTKIHVDNESAICVVKNPVSHSKTKHIEIRYHFIRDSYEKKLIEMIKIHTDYNVADLLTKAFDVTRYRGLYTNEFWQTATVETVNDGEQQITVTVDGQTIAITEASVRRHLQLADADGISSLPNTKIFEQLTLMGYVSNDDKLTFQKGGDTPGSDKGSKKLNELTELVKKVKHLEDKLRSTTESRKSRMVISDDEEDLVSEDPSKQGRMTEIEYEDVNVETEYEEVDCEFDQTDTMQQITPTKVPQGVEQNQESSEVQLDILSAVKILAEASR
ncbi:putative ribonuclease H-like domain-containing protein [Tanacetum coccineum]